MKVKHLVLSGLLFVNLITLQGALLEDNARWRRRDDWQNVKGIFEAMAISEGSAVADIGCKDGYLTVRLAPVVGAEGRVYGVDIDRSALRKLERNLKARGITNVTAVHSETDDPKLASKSIDAAVVVNAYHEMGDYESMLRHIKDALKPGGRLVLVEPISEKRFEQSREDQEDDHELAMHFARNDLENAGFIVTHAQKAFVTRQTDGNTMWLLVGVKAESL